MEKRGSRRANGGVPDGKQPTKTDYSRWRLLDERGRQTWHYLRTDDEVKKWPQSVADKYFLGLPTGLPDLKTSTTPLQAVNNGLSFYSKLQLPPGNWGCEYGGPMFLLPGLVITWYVTETPVPESHSIEIKNYLFTRQHEDGGWGLHVEAHSSVFGTALNYTCLRLLGAHAEDPRMVKARGKLHEMGGAVYGPHWSKFWLAVLGVFPWSIVNPTPPELWLLPDWLPIAPWRWWIHMRQVFLPMSFVYSKRWSYPPTALTMELRNELFVEPYEAIDFASHRNSISPLDNFHPKTWILNLINWIFVHLWIPYLLTKSLQQKAEAWTWKLIQMEDANTDYSNLGPVNGPMNLLACYIQEGPGAYSVRRHRERMEDFLWVKSEGMLMNGTNGVQNWDTAFTIHAVIECGLAEDPRWKPMLVKALEYLESQQTLENCKDHEVCYRHPTKGAWGFSNKDQGYSVSDCTAEAVKAILLLQKIPSYPNLVSERRIKDAIDMLLTMQNDTGGCSSYEPRRGSELLEYLNAAEVFGRIMVEYDYPECTTACISALNVFRKQYPDYRAKDIETFIQRAVSWIRSDQRADGSWYGAWAICFTYAGMFALQALRSMGETYANSERVRRACQFFLDRQMDDGGWGESYKSCEDGVYTQHEKSQVVQTAWVCIALMEADYPEVEPIQKAVKLIMSRQLSNGEWPQEAIEGVFNKSCMISYPNYKFIFTIKALGMFARKHGDMVLQ
ncbi:oxidosqualene:lanosterol cyclase-like protein [Trichodelitschia bisporula]|uniref:Terpene cyclase/mutase family member n=1 Tax=Trichodelitschia bisporula TaxID=703511 RepID=A0A6G1I422_9PEZI|nr:oxidosqualene:lanosterol cyclase-like protein [Trichodelitschia bisporula]